MATAATRTLAMNFRAMIFPFQFETFEWMNGQRLSRMG
jgi:hypothetical protein